MNKKLMSTVMLAVFVMGSAPKAYADGGATAAAIGATAVGAAVVGYLIGSSKKDKDTTKSEKRRNGKESKSTKKSKTTDKSKRSKKSDNNR